MHTQYFISYRCKQFVFGEALCVSDTQTTPSSWYSLLPPQDRNGNGKSEGCKNCTVVILLYKRPNVHVHLLQSYKTTWKLRKGIGLHTSGEKTQSWILYGYAVVFTNMKILTLLTRDQLWAKGKCDVISSDIQS